MKLKSGAVIYDDWLSVGHTLLGVLAGKMGILLVVSILFLAYESWNDDTKEEKAGNVLEFGAGVILSLLF